jgi:uncharacterized repeat protein (TIGR01451 family)
MKGLLGATALTVLSAGTAFAQNNFTAASTTVSNTFTLDYQVNNTAQTQIENSGSPTNFAVDRLVNVTVTSPANTFVVANQADALLPFVVVNNGNDEHAYLLGFEQAGGDDFNTSAATTAPDIIFYDETADTNNDGALSEAERAAATPQSYNPASGSVNIPVLAADERVFVYVRQNMPAGLADNAVGGIALYANTQTIVSGTGTSLVYSETSGDTDGNDINPMTVENVLADLSGPASTTNDDTTDGAHSARGDYIIENPNVAATKEVFGIASATPNTCDAIPASASYTKPTANTEYFTPQSCVEYIIQVNNEGSTEATAINLTDILPDNLTIREAAVLGDLVLPTTAPVGSLSQPAAGTPCDGTAVCTVSVTNATLASGSTATPTIGYLVIRATIN